MTWPNTATGCWPVRISDKERGDDFFQDVLRYREVFGDRCYLLVELHHIDDERILAASIDLAKRARVPAVAAGGVHFHIPGATIPGRCADRDSRRPARCRLRRVAAHQCGAAFEDGGGIGSIVSGCDAAPHRRSSRSLHVLAQRVAL